MKFQSKYNKYAFYLKSYRQNGGYFVQASYLIAHWGQNKMTTIIIEAYVYVSFDLDGLSCNMENLLKWSIKKQFTHRDNPACWQVCVWLISEGRRKPACLTALIYRLSGREIRTPRCYQDDFLYLVHAVYCSSISFLMLWVRNILYDKYTCILLNEPLEKNSSEIQTTIQQILFKKTNVKSPQLNMLNGRPL